MLLKLKNFGNGLIEKHPRLIVYSYVSYLFFISFFILNFIGILNNNYNYSIIYNKNTGEYKFFNKKNFPNIKICNHNNRTYLCNKKNNKTLDNYEYLSIMYIFDKNNTKFYIHDKVPGLTEKQQLLLLFILIFIFLIPQFVTMFKISRVIDKNKKNFEKTFDVMSFTVIANLMFHAIFICMIPLATIEVIKNSNNLKKQKINENSITSILKNNLTDSYICINYTNKQVPVIIVNKNKVEK